MEIFFFFSFFFLGGVRVCVYMISNTGMFMASVYIKYSILYEIRRALIMLFFKRLSVFYT